MGLVEGPITGTLAGVAAQTAQPVHVVAKPNPVYNSSNGGHYRTSYRYTFATSQAANSRLVELRSASLLTTIERVRIQLFQAANAAAEEIAVSVYRLTNFTAVDNVSVQSPGISKLRTSFPASTCSVTCCTATGVAAGMTGGTLTKDTNPLFEVPMWSLVTLGTGRTNRPAVFDYAPQVRHGEYPLTLNVNEGLLIENLIGKSGAGAIVMTVDLEWSEALDY